MQLNIPIQEEKQKVKLQVSEKKRPDYLWTTAHMQRPALAVALTQMSGRCKRGQDVWAAAEPVNMNINVQ